MTFLIASFLKTKETKKNVFKLPYCCSKSYFCTDSSQFQPTQHQVELAELYHVLIQTKILHMLTESSHRVACKHCMLQNKKTITVEIHLEVESEPFSMSINQFLVCADE